MVYFVILGGIIKKSEYMNGRYGCKVDGGVL